jgi:hypothetical protein
VDKPVKEPPFRNPPQWIHESVAARFFAPLARRREAKRRAVLELLNRIPATPPSSPPSAARRSRS